MGVISRSAGMGLVALCVLLAGLAAGAVDTTPPTGTVIINNNRTATKAAGVTLTLTWADGTGGSGVSRMRFSNDGSTWTTWEPLANPKAYTLPAGDGYKTVRVQFMDKALNKSVIYNDFIRLDTVAPTGGIVINDGAPTTTSRTVTLKLNWGDPNGGGVARMRFSDNGSTWTAWEPVKATRTHTLPDELGYHTVRVQYTDTAENYSSIYNDFIKLMEPAPGTIETVLLPGMVTLTMVWVPRGSFMMGRYAGEQDSSSSEDPQHAVALGGFWMGKYEVTKRQWQVLKGTTPWGGQDYVLADLDSPAVYVSWNDTQSFLTALNSCTGKTFRLPSEAQWEYACRAGKTTRFYWDDDPACTLIDDYAWYVYNCPGELYAHLVGQKTANAYGLCDMSGNVFEWCQDYWHSDYTGAPADGSAWETPAASYRVIRGGSWMFNGNLCRSAGRSLKDANETSASLGFRVVLTP